MDLTPTASSATLESLAGRVQQREVGGCTLLALPTPIRDVVSWQGSFLTHPDFAEGEELLQVLTVGLLDKGTRRRDRFAIAEVLENRGAQLSFSSDGHRVSFEGRAMRADWPLVLEVLAEQLRAPLFDAEEFEKAKANYAAALHRSMEQTRSQAVGVLSRRIYSPAHPNYQIATEDALARLEAFTLEQVQAYHQHHFGSNGLLLVVVGDVDQAATEDAVAAGLGDWPAHAAPPAFAVAAAPQPPGVSRLPMAGKHNVDVRMGHALPVLRPDADYLPLFVAAYILGGNFSARLMTKIRGEMGLTYGIQAGLSGISTLHQGHWQVGVTLSQENVAVGIDAVRAEVDHFVQEGVTAEEVAEKQTTLTGGFKVGLATTGGLADTLHLNATRGFDVHYLDRFPEEVLALTRDQINDALARHFDPARFQLAVAGVPPDA